MLLNNLYTFLKDLENIANKGRKGYKKFSTIQYPENIACAAYSLTDFDSNYIKYYNCFDTKREFEDKYKEA